MVRESPFCSFSLASTTARTAKYINCQRQLLSSVSLDRRLLELDRLFWPVGNDFLNLLLDSTFLRIGEQFEKDDTSTNAWRKKSLYAKLGSHVCLLFTWESRASVAQILKIAPSAHFLVTRLRAVRKPYEATSKCVWAVNSPPGGRLSQVSLACSGCEYFYTPF